MNIIISGIIVLHSLTLGEKFESGFCRSSSDMEGSQGKEHTGHSQKCIVAMATWLFLL